MKFENTNAPTSSHNGNQTTENSSNGSMQSSQLMKLFEGELKDIYWVSKALTTAIPKIIKNTKSPELIDALTSHLAEAESQVARVEQVFESLNNKAVAQNSDAMQDLIKKTGGAMQTCEVGSVQNSNISPVAKKEEVRENVSYERLRHYVDTLGITEVENQFESTREEIKKPEVKRSDNTFFQHKKWAWPSFLQTD